METARAILDRGGIVLIFPEGTRIRPGALGHPHRGVGRLALETGAPVVPISVYRHRGRPPRLEDPTAKVVIRAGRPLRFPVVPEPSRELAGAVTDRIWPCVMLQWEWLGGLPPICRAAIIGAGKWGTSLAVSLARAGIDVDLGCRTHEQAAAIQAARANEAYLPDISLPDSIRIKRAADLDLEGADLVCLAVPARALPGVLAAHGERIPRAAGLLVLSKGPVPPLAHRPPPLPPSAAPPGCGRPWRAAHAAEAIYRGASVVVAATDRALAKQLPTSCAEPAWTSRSPPT